MRRAEPYFSNKLQAARTAEHQAEIILKNLAALRQVDKGLKLEKIVRDFDFLMRNGEPLSANQLSYLDGIYEKVMGVLGLGSVPLHHDMGKRRA